MVTETRMSFVGNRRNRLRFVVGLGLSLFAAIPSLAEDRLDMDAVAIKGTRELPKVLYIVPWKSARLGSLVAGAGSDIFATDWTALNRGVFRRQVAYYDILAAASDSPGVR